MKCVGENIDPEGNLLSVHKLRPSVSKQDVVDEDYSSRWAALL